MRYNIVIASFNFLMIKVKVWNVKKQFCPAHPVSRLRGNKGVLILEYVLLLVACVGIAAIVQKFFELGADEETSGFFINQWMKMLEIIAEDI